MKAKYEDCKYLRNSVGSKEIPSLMECNKRYIKVVIPTGEYIDDMSGDVCIVSHMKNTECLSFEPNFFGIVKETLKKVEIKDI